MELCPCGSQPEYSVCCEPYISGAARAPTAEKLMRARYSAYAKTAVDFIIDTTIDEKRKECDEKAIRDWSEHSTWHKLEIISIEKGTPSDTDGVIEFIAHFSEGGIRKNYHEKGSFKNVDGARLHVDGEIQKQKPFVRSEAKQSRNGPCSCGSGKKFKKCRGRQHYPVRQSISFSFTAYLPLQRSFHHVILIGYGDRIIDRFGPLTDNADNSTAISRDV